MLERVACKDDNTAEEKPGNIESITKIEYKNFAKDMVICHHMVYCAQYNDTSYHHCSQPVEAQSASLLETWCLNRTSITPKTDCVENPIMATSGNCEMSIPQTFNECYGL